MLSVNQTLMKSFAERVVKHNQVCSRFINIMLVEIQKERKGDILNVDKKCIIDGIKITKDIFDGKLDFYRENFEPTFLSTSEQFFK